MWYAVSNYPIIWTSNGLSSAARVTKIVLKQAGQGTPVDSGIDETVRTLYNSSAGLPVSGSFTWNVDASYATGSGYYIVVEVTGGPGDNFSTHTTESYKFSIGPFSYQ